MNDPELQVTVDLEDEPAITAPEMQLLADLLPEIIKNLILLQEDNEG